MSSPVGAALVVEWLEVDFEWNASSGDDGAGWQLVVDGCGGGGSGIAGEEVMLCSCFGGEISDRQTILLGSGMEGRDCKSVRTPLRGRRLE